MKPDFRRFHVILTALGVDLPPIYKALHIKPTDFAGHGAGVSMVNYLAVLDMAAAQVGNASLGLEVGRQRTKDDLGVVGLMVRNAPTLEQAINIVCRYLNLVSPGADTALEPIGKQCLWRYDYPGFAPQRCRQSVEATMVQFVDLIRQVTAKPDWVPDCVYLRHHSPVNEKPVRDALGDELIFDHYQSGIVFPKTLLSLPMNKADPAILAILEEQVQASLQNFDQKRDLRARVSFLIASGLGKTDVSLVQIARDVGMSRRSLARYLDQSGTSYHQLRDNVVETFAKRLLVTTRASVTEIALVLGFSDASAFNNSFKRLTGTTPLKYRKQYAG